MCGLNWSYRLNLNEAKHMPKEFLTVDDIAILFGVSVPTVRRWIKAGKLQGQKAGGQWRFERETALDAHRKGSLSGGSNNRVNKSSSISYLPTPEWAAQLLDPWRSALESVLAKDEPDHVIVNDRRGAKVWQRLANGMYKWGENLWHSTVVNMMSDNELQMFRKRKVLLFDEMMQHGQAMHTLRLRLEETGAKVNSFVCICRKSHFDRGETLEYKAHICENLKDHEFGQRATAISRLLRLFTPPLDVDHLVVKGKLVKEYSPEEIVSKLAHWGKSFLVTRPDPDSDCHYLAVTLDRPQFFETDRVKDERFTVYWDGPCKFRLYINQDTGDCFCSFITYPRLVAEKKVWEQELTQRRRTDLTQEKRIGGSETKVYDGPYHQIYEKKCMNFAVSLFEDFMVACVADSVGISLGNTADAVDADQLKATFGNAMADHIERKVRNILGVARSGRDKITEEALSPPPLNLRDIEYPNELSRYSFRCRTDLLNLVPQKHVIDQLGNVEEPPRSYADIIRELSNYSETTIGKTFDYEIDWGTLKPVIYVRYTTEKAERQLVELGRGFYRGEYDNPFEYNESAIHSQKDNVIQQMLAICPIVLEQFLKRTNREKVTATHFAKIFANLRQDWPKKHFGALYYFLRPYKYGPIPIVPHLAESGRLLGLDEFLVGEGCVDLERELHGKSIWRTFLPGTEEKIPWRRLYELKTDGSMKAHIGALTRLYSEIQNKCDTHRSSPRKEGVISVFKDPLVVLGAVRNKRTAYICSWFEVDDWRTKGRMLMQTLKAMAVDETIQISGPILTRECAGFAEPARLLFDKIEMYKNLPYLRKQIEKLRDSGDFEIAHLVLETVDEEPEIECESDFPVGNLKWACEIMRPFTSLLRQVLSICGLDSPKKKLREGNSDETRGIYEYLDNLLAEAPELKPLEPQLRDCISNLKKGTLNGETVKLFAKVFEIILHMFDSRNRIPKPPLRREDILREEMNLDLMACLKEIPLQDPYYVAVTDIKNFIGIATYLSKLIENDVVDEAATNLLIQIKNRAKDIVGTFENLVYCGISSDTLIFAGPSPDDVVLCAKELIAETMQDIESDIRELGHLGLLRVGIALHQKALGLEYGGILPGTTAFKIGDKRKRKLGDIAVTEAVYKNLSPDTQRTFALSENEQCGQEAVYLRHWNVEIDNR